MKRYFFFFLTFHVTFSKSRLCRLKEAALCDDMAKMHVYQLGGKCEWI